MTFEITNALNIDSVSVLVQWQH